MREIFEAEFTVSPPPIKLEQRVVELERQVQKLEAEIAALKKRRVH